METVNINGETFTVPVEVKDTMDGLFNVHETFMVQLCEILELDYLEATRDDIIQEVRKIKELLRFSKALQFIAGEYSPYDPCLYYGNPNCCGIDGCNCDGLFAKDILEGKKLPKGLEEILETPITKWK